MSTLGTGRSGRSATAPAGRLVAALDLGGTKIAAGALDEDGGLRAELTVPTPAADGPEAVLDAAAGAVRGLGPPVTALGVGSAGVVDPGNGLIRSATDALPGWTGTDLRGGLSARLDGLPVAVENDVHAHARGEAWLGAAAGLRYALLVAVGTGIGGAVLADGRVLHGHHGVAGHLGHVPAPSAAGARCACGGTGHAEAVGSGPAMLTAYSAYSGDSAYSGGSAYSGDTASGARPAAGTSRATGLPEVAALAADGDEQARSVLAQGARALGEVVGGLANTLAPQAVLLTGGVTRCGDTWWSPLRAAIEAELLPPLRGLSVRTGVLGDRAALTGAARLALDMLDGSAPVPGPAPDRGPAGDSTTDTDARTTT